jgi:hypothetical protein
VRVRDDSSARHRWGLAGYAGGTVTAGVGGPLTGRGADVLIVDDPIKNAEEANSELQRERAAEWFKAVALTRLEPNGSVILIATRWHMSDLIGRVTRDEPDRWRAVNLPAIAEDKDELGRAPGEALWPERWPLQALEATKRSIGSYWWSAMYMGRPTPLSATCSSANGSAPSTPTDGIPRRPRDRAGRSVPPILHGRPRGEHQDDGRLDSHRDVGCCAGSGAVAAP